MRIRSLTLLCLVLAGCAAPTAAPAAVTPSPTPTSAPVSVVPPASPTAIPLTAQAAYEQGVARQSAGDATGARAAFDQALALDPTFAPAYVARGALYLAAGSPRNALADAQSALVADPQSSAAYALLGEVLRRGFADPLQALEAYERAVELDPALAELLFPARWRAATAAGQAARLLELAGEYAGGHAEDPLAAAYRGQALIAAGAPGTAVDELVAVLTEGGPAALWFTLGQAYAAQDAWAEARVCYEQAWALMESGDRTPGLLSETPTADLWAGLGQAYLYTGDCAAALEALERALAEEERPDRHTLIGQAMVCLLPTPTPLPTP